MRTLLINGLLAFVFILPISTIGYADNLNVSLGTPTLDGVETTNEWPVESITTATGVNLKAMVDDMNFYLLAVWDDDSGTESKDKKMWSYDGQDWSQSGNEDRLGIVWDMGQNGMQGANCMGMCHTPDMQTMWGRVDLWHWKAHRGNPIGYVDDTYIDTVSRHGDEGSSSYSDNVDGDLPAYMAPGDPGVNATFLMDSDQVVFDPFGVTENTAAVKTAFDPLAAWGLSDHIAGYVLRTPSGSRADVQTAGRYDNGTWTVEFSRPIMANSQDDFIPTPGGTVEFAVAEFDNTGDSDHTVDINPHYLHFPLFTSVDPISGKEAPTDFGLVSSFPNPFNAETTISYQIEEPGMITLRIYDLRGQLIEELFHGLEETGTHNLAWNPEGLSAGIYIAQLNSVNQSSINKMLYLK